MTARRFGVLVSSAGDCPVPENPAVLTLPSATALVYFCAGPDTGLLTAVTNQNGITDGCSSSTGC